MSENSEDSDEKKGDCAGCRLRGDQKCVLCELKHESHADDSVNENQISLLDISRELHELDAATATKIQPKIGTKFDDMGSLFGKKKEQIIVSDDSLDVL